MVMHNASEPEEYSDLFDRAFEKLVGHEGGWVDHPNDPGGETFMGITRKNWESQTRRLWEEVDKAKEDGTVLSLHREARVLEYVKAFYWSNFWYTYGCNELDHGELVTLHLSFCVLRPRGAVETVQYLGNELRGAGIKEDGLIGPNTRKAINLLDNMNDEEVVKAEAMYREMMSDILNQVSKSNPDLEVFAKGWQRRATGGDSVA